jgi:death-on-curing protein
VNRSDWKWVRDNSVLAIHDEQIAEHGGVPGVRDESLLLSALAKPHNLAAYGKPDLPDLAAAYATGIARNHAFFDGNKRTAWVVAEVFLLKNGQELMASDRAGVEVMFAVAAGSISEAELAAWIRKWIKRLPRQREI